MVCSPLHCTDAIARMKATISSHLFPQATNGIRFYNELYKYSRDFFRLTLSGRQAPCACGCAVSLDVVHDFAASVCEILAPQTEASHVSCC